MDKLFYCIRNKLEVNPFIERIKTQDLDGDAVVVALKDLSLEEIEIPETIEGCLVNEIGKEAFFHTSLKRIVLPSTILVLGENCFPKDAIIIFEGAEFDAETIGYEINRRYNYVLNEQIDGVIEAVYQQDEIMDIVKKGESIDEVYEKIQERFGFTDIQAKTILDIPLSILNQLDVSQLESLKVEMDEN